MKELKLMNYTTDVPAEKSILEIEKLLTRAGATKIAKDFMGDGTVTAFFFAIPSQYGDLMFRMPCEIDNVYATLMKGYRRPHRGTEKKVREQASKVAWRILLDWIEAQITMIRLEQVKPQQAFLPYAYDPRTNQTLYEKLESKGFNLLALESGK